MKKQFRVKFPPEIGNDEISPSLLTHIIPMKLSFQKKIKKTCLYQIVATIEFQVHQTVPPPSKDDEIEINNNVLDYFSS